MIKKFLEKIQIVISLEDWMIIKIIKLSRNGDGKMKIQMNKIRKEVFQE